MKVTWVESNGGVDFLRFLACRDGVRWWCLRAGGKMRDRARGRARGSISIRYPLIYVSIFALHFVLHSFVLPPLLLQIILWLPRLAPIVSTKSTDSNICCPLAEKLLKWIGLRSSPGLKVEVPFALYAYERNVRYLWAVVLEEEASMYVLFTIFSTSMIEMLCHNAGVSLPFTVPVEMIGGQREANATQSVWRSFVQVQ